MSMYNSYQTTNIPDIPFSPPPPKLPELPAHADVGVLRDILSEGSSTAMPFWTAQDTRNALLATLIPGGASVAAFAVFARDQDVVNWWTDLRKPDWAPRDIRLYSTVDFLTLAPLGYASYLVYKNGGGFDYNDTRLALGLYGANIGLALFTVPLVKKKNLGCLWKNAILVHLSAAAAAYAFYKIDKTAGLWMTPYAIWSSFYAFLTYAIDKENRVVKNI